MTTLDPEILWLLVGICIFLLLVFAARYAYTALTTTHEQRIRVEAQRRMLRFCKNPTRLNYRSAWDYIDDENVRLAELDWPLVQRFSRTAVGRKLGEEVGT
jgi:hypothetical protein